MIDNERGQKVLSGDDDLPDHTVAMRRASQHCNQLFASLPSSLTLDIAENYKSKQIFTRRQQVYEDFWSQECPTIEVIYVSEVSSPQEFRERFHHQNLPCLINGLECFDGTNRHWRKENGSVNRTWFLEQVGEETLVPLRYQPQPSALDSDGRATECQTRNVSMKEWIQILEKDGANSYYLKDWHLILQLEGREQSSQLYTCPEVFQYDLLNSFLMKFTKGDYRFCYWGPEKSTTSRHSDVLHSFSWSYNVIGTKQWTFFFGDTDRQFTVIQKAGQAMFVPCTWQHEVVNLEETISINHNWITTANIDKTWECLVSEMTAIQIELREWGIADNLESCESMLRGCVGLDVTAFFLMVLVRLLELLARPGVDQHTSERSFDIFRLANMSQILTEDDSIHLEGRLEAILQSEALAHETLNIGKELVVLVHRNAL
jgi:hypothetical protein